MRETLELLEDLLIEGEQGEKVDYSDQIELAVVAVLRDHLKREDVMWFGGKASPFDVKIGNDEWEVKQFSPDGSELARIGSGKSSKLDSHPTSKLIMSIASAIIRNDEFLRQESTKDAPMKEAIDWFRSSSSGSKMDRVSALAEMWITKSTMESIKAGDLGKHLTSIHNFLIRYIGLSEAEGAEPQFDVIIRQQDTGTENNLGTVGDRALQLKVKPAVQSASGATIPGKNLAAAADVFNVVDDAIKKKDFIVGLTGKLWVDLLTDIAGAKGFIGVDVANVRSSGPGQFEVTLDRVKTFNMSELSIASIDTKRPRPQPIGAGTQVNITPGASISANVAGSPIRVTVNSTSGIGSASAAKVYVAINDIQGLKLAPIEGIDSRVSSLMNAMDDGSTKGEDIRKAMQKIADEKGPLSGNFKKWLVDNPEAAKSSLKKIILSTVKEYAADLQPPGGEATITGAVDLSQENAGRLRPGPLVSETLTLLEDLLTP